MQKLTVKDTEINITKMNGEDYLCITDMLKAKRKNERQNKGGVIAKML